MKKAKGKSVLSKLTKEVKNRKSHGMHPNAISKHVVTSIEDPNAKNMRSNLDTKNLDEFLDLAKLAKKQYDVLNEQIVMQSLSSNTNKEILQNQYNNVFLKNSLKNTDIRLYETKPLAIPKRPKWKEGISAVEYDRMEREAFLNWRRALAQEEESNVNYAITPFEKNIEVWRQLWLVVEKCSLLIQIVDGRNPLYFRCPDLEKYIQEAGGNKNYLLLINKADLMNEGVRKSWADYFKEHNINYAFFSALDEAKKIEDEILAEVRANEVVEDQDDEEEDVSDEDDYGAGINNNKFKMFNFVNNYEDEDEPNQITNTNNLTTETTKTENGSVNKVTEVSSPQVDQHIINNVEVNDRSTEINPILEINSQTSQQTPPEQTNASSPVIDSQVVNSPTIQNEDVRVYNREQLIELIKGRITIKVNSPNYVGFIGYPNVGKSSVINVLMQKKKVGVASMPGKTKHYQTLFLPGEHKDICLMDCPGLVFPSFTSSRADMAVNGIIPIDTLREFQSPASIIIGKIPRRVLEWFYKLELPDIYSATQFLQILAQKRGFITGRSLPDEAKTAKMVLKDYNTGKLLYCNLRPDYKPEIHGTVIPYDTACLAEIDEEEKQKLEIIKEIPADFDDDFEKINIDVDVNRNLKTNIENFDQQYFGFINKADEVAKLDKDKPMNKDMKRALKFAVKRGEITEEEYEEAMTVEDYEAILARINAKGNKKDLVGVKIINVATN